MVMVGWWRLRMYVVLFFFLRATRLSPSGVGECLFCCWKKSIWCQKDRARKNSDVKEHWFLSFIVDFWNVQWLDSFRKAMYSFGWLPSRLEEFGPSFFFVFLFFIWLLKCRWSTISYLPAVPTIHIIITFIFFWQRLYDSPLSRPMFQRYGHYNLQFRVLGHKVDDCEMMMLWALRPFWSNRVNESNCKWLFGSIFDELAVTVSFSTIDGEFMILATHSHNSSTLPTLKAVRLYTCSSMVVIPFKTIVFSPPGRSS